MGWDGCEQDTLLPMFFNQARSLRLADGPDEVHKAHDCQTDEKTPTSDDQITTR